MSLPREDSACHTFGPQEHIAYLWSWNEAGWLLKRHYQIIGASSNTMGTNVIIVGDSTVLSHHQVNCCVLKNRRTWGHCWWLHGIITHRLNEIKKKKKSFDFYFQANLLSFILQNTVCNIFFLFILRSLSFNVR